MAEQSQKLVVIDDEDIPLADSRQVAEELGIEHRSFFKLITEYQEEVEEDFGKVRFEIAPSGKTNQSQKYAKLTEDQSYVYLAYSQNTPQARACKRNLVKAFAEARSLLTEKAFTQIDPSQFIDIKALDETIGKLQQLRKMKLSIAKRRAGILSNIAHASVSPEEKRRLILYYVGVLPVPTARELGRYIKRCPLSEIKLLLGEMVIEGLLTRQLTLSGRTYVYALVEQKQLV